MRFYKHDVERLTHLLASPRASSVTMGLSELDGYLTAVFLCPEFIPPSDWLELVFGGNVPDGFPEDDLGEQITKNIVGHLEYIADKAKTRRRLQPIFASSEETDHVSWYPWIKGFNLGVGLRKDVWEALFDHSDEVTRSALSLLLVLQEIAEGKSSFEAQLTATLTDDALELIPGAIVELFPQARPDLFEEVPNSSKRKIKRPKRNDFCPCGSDYLYKQCCGKN